MPLPSPPVPNANQIFQPGLFDGKVILATGGGSGIVKDMVEAIMSLGAHSIIIGRSLERVKNAAAELEKATKRECQPCSADVRNPDQLREAVKKGVERFGRVDFVICGAAGNFLAPIDGLSENAFKTVMDIDTLGTYNTIKATIPHLKSSHGAYIHVSATLHYRGFPYQAHVSAAKAAVDALSAVVAVEFAPHGVRSNVIAPGLITGTEGADRLGRGMNGDRGPMLGRWGEKADIACMAAFLFSPAAAWITGQIFVVDGGESHMQLSPLPYPQSVLDPKGTLSALKARM